MQNTSILIPSSSDYDSPAKLAYLQWENSLTVPVPLPVDPLLKRKEKSPSDLQVKRIDLNATPPSPAGGCGGPLGLLPVRNLRQNKIDEHQELASTCSSGSEYFYK